MALRQAYETVYGIFNHQGPDDPETPWPLMANTFKEDLSRVSPLKFRLDQYADNRVFDIFGISFDDLLEYPRREYLEVIEAAKRANQRNTTGVGSRLDSLEAELRKLNKMPAGRPPHK